MFYAPVAVVGEGSHLRADASSYSAPGSAVSFSFTEKMKAETLLQHGSAFPLIKST